MWTFGGTIPRRSLTFLSHRLQSLRESSFLKGKYLRHLSMRHSGGVMVGRRWSPADVVLEMGSSMEASVFWRALTALKWTSSEDHLG